MNAALTLFDGRSLITAGIVSLARWSGPQIFLVVIHFVAARILQHGVPDVVDEDVVVVVGDVVVVAVAFLHMEIADF